VEGKSVQEGQDLFLPSDGAYDQQYHYVGRCEDTTLDEKSPCAENSDVTSHIHHPNQITSIEDLLNIILIFQEINPSKMRVVVHKTNLILVPSGENRSGTPNIGMNQLKRYHSDTRNRNISLRVFVVGIALSTSSLYNT
jgi:hypothetical protein